MAEVVPEQKALEVGRGQAAAKGRSGSRNSSRGRSPGIDPAILNDWDNEIWDRAEEDDQEMDL